MQISFWFRVLFLPKRRNGSYAAEMPSRLPLRAPKGNNLQVEFATLDLLAVLAGGELLVVALVLAWDEWFSKGGESAFLESEVSSKTTNFAGNSLHTFFRFDDGVVDIVDAFSDFVHWAHGNISLLSATINSDNSWEEKGKTGKDKEWDKDSSQWETIIVVAVVGWATVSGTAVTASIGWSSITGVWSTITGIWSTIAGSWSTVAGRAAAAAVSITVTGVVAAMASVSTVWSGKGG